MRKRRGIFGAFLFFLFIAILLLFAFRSTLLNSLYGVVQLGILPVQRAVHISFWNLTVKQTTEEQLMDENKQLRSQLVSMDELKKENAALHDQFDSTETSIYEQIPTHIVGTKGFVPGISLPSQFILDKGEKEGIRKGNAVVYKNNLVGVVVRVTPHVSLIDPITKQGFSLTGRDLKTNALGVIKGQGDGVIVDNVVLSDKLNINDVLVTKGDLNQEGIGVPPNLIVGKISSIDRRPSNLFQSAELQSFVDTNHLSTVFILQIKK